MTATACIFFSANLCVPLPCWPTESGRQCIFSIWGGYGWLDRVSADRFFEWMDDDLISIYINIGKTLDGTSHTLAIREGYGTLFHALYDRLTVAKHPTDHIQRVQVADSAAGGVRLHNKRIPISFVFTHNPS